MGRGGGGVENNTPTSQGPGRAMQGAGGLDVRCEDLSVQAAAVVGRSVGGPGVLSRKWAPHPITSQFLGAP